MTALHARDQWPVCNAAAAVVGPTGVLASHGDTDRRFALASVTKLLVARAAQVAIEEGAVDLQTAAGPPGSAAVSCRDVRSGPDGARRPVAGAVRSSVMYRY